MFKTSLFKSMMAGVLACSLALTSPAPARAQDQFDNQDAVVGLLALLLIGAAIHHSRDDDPAPAPVPVADWRDVPLQCLRHAIRDNGNRINYYGQRCMTNNYGFHERLPAVCHVRFTREDGRQRQGYRRGCLRNHGFRVNQR